MTNQNTLRFWKTVAKQIAREGRIAHHVALDLVAVELGQPHWNAFSGAWRKGWRPEPPKPDEVRGRPEEADIMAIPVLGIGCGVQEHGTIDGHPYTLTIDFEVLLTGRGWAICVEQAPSEKPTIEKSNRYKKNPIDDPEFVSKALVICNAAVERLRGRIARDWPRRSLKPDAEGRTVHPLFDRGLSKEWHCLHCEAVSSGAQMAANMWHCPKCSATPLDIFMEPFWRSTT